MEGMRSTKHIPMDMHWVAEESDKMAISRQCLQQVLHRQL